VICDPSGPHSQLGQVVHEFVPLSELFPSDDSDGLLIVPEGLSPWFQYSEGMDYKAQLDRRTILVGRPPARFSLRQVPKYLAYDCARTMTLYESEHNYHGKPY
jgi:hypothetical protein